MIEQLISFLQDTWDYLVPWVVVDQFEGGVVLRLGKYHRDLQPGFNWMVPFIEQPMTTSVVTTTTHLDPQSMHTHDGESLVVSTIIKYSISRPLVRSYLLEIEDREDVLCDVTMGAVRSAIQGMDLEDVLLNDSQLEKEVKRSVRNQTRKYGFDVERITFATLASITTMRLMHDGVVISGAGEED